MICLRCGYCCQHLCVVIVDDPTKGITEDNLITHGQEGKKEDCKHLRGDKPGEYACALHDEEWYEDTPCFQHGQFERSPETPCRIGVHVMKKEKMVT